MANQAAFSHGFMSNGGTIVTTGVAVLVPTVGRSAFYIKALSDNAAKIVIGSNASVSNVTKGSQGTINGYVLDPGEVTSLLNGQGSTGFWINGTAGDSVCFIGS